LSLTRGAGRKAELERRRSLLLHAACALILLAGVIIAFQDVVGFDRGLMFRDHTSVFKPRWWFVTQSLRRGELPVSGNPGDPTGVPFELLLNATYTPATLLLVLFGPFDVIYDYFVMSHVFVLAIGAYVLAVSLGASRIEALAGASVAAFSGPILSFECLLVALVSLSYVPWMLWAFSRTIERPTLGRASLLGIFTSFHVQGLLPEFVVLDVIGAGLIFWCIRPRLHARLVVMLFLGAILGLAISAVEIMPLVLGLGHTRRGQGFTYEEASRWPMHAIQSLELIAPNFWAPVDVPMIENKELTTFHQAPYLASLYLGSALCVSAAAFWNDSAKRLSLALAAVIGVMLLLAAGPATPLHRLIAQLPLLRSGRFPVKFLVVVSFAIAAMVPLALRTVENKPRVLIALAGLQTALLAVALFALSTSAFERYLTHALDDHEVTPIIGITARDYPLLALSAMERRLVHALAFSGLVLAGALAGWIRVPIRAGREAAPDVPSSRRILYVLKIGSIRPGTREAGRSSSKIGPRAVASAAVLLDLAFAGRFSIQGADLEPSGPPNEINSRIDSREHRYFAIDPATQGAAARHRSDKTFLEDLHRSVSLRGLGRTRTARPFGDIDPDAESNRASVLTLNVIESLKPRRAREMLGRAGVAWLSVVRPDPTARGVIPFDVEGEEPQYLIPVERVRPYVSAWERALVVDLDHAQPIEFALALTAASTSSAAVILDAAFDPSRLLALSSTGAAPVRAELKKRTTDGRSYEIETEGERPAVVVLQEIMHPGWSVSIDGARSRIWPVEIGYMGAEVPSGKHRVRFEYDAIAPGWLPMSAVAMIIALALVAAEWRRGTSTS
jgi:hypothetical protein